MRIKHATFAFTTVALASLISPVMAKNSDAQKTSEQAIPSPCSAQQRTSDGTWIQLPCREIGTSTQPTSKSATEARTNKRAEKSALGQ